MSWRATLPYVFGPILVVLGGLRAVDGGLIRDDQLFVATNPHVTQPVPIDVVFRTPLQPDHELGLYRPLATLSLRLDYVLSLLLHREPDLRQAPVFHITNLVLAALASVCLVALARGLGFGPTAAGMCGALFAAHPARTDAVLWISGRAECLMTLFSLAALAVAVRGDRWWRVPTAALLALCAFFSKEQGIVVLLLLPTLPRLDRFERVRHLIATATALGAGFAWRYHVLGGMGPTGPQQVLQGAPLLERIGLGIGAFGDYVGKSLWPHPLLNEYDDPTGGIPAGSVAWVILFAGALAWWVHRKNTRGVWALALFAIPLGPVLNIAYRTGETFAERFLALPVAGICLALTLIASMRPRIGSFILTGLVIAFLALTVKRAGDYQSDEALMEALVRDAPHQASSYRLLAGVPMRNWDTAIKLGNEVEAREHARQAIELFEKAVAANPRDFMARLDLARFLATLGAPKIAGGAANTEWLLESQRLAASVAAERPKLHEAHKILGQALAGHGVASAGPERARLLAEAETSLREAIALEPRETQAAQSLMRILDHLKRPAEAIDVARTMLGRLRELGDRRWWDPSLLLHQAAVLRSLATLERDPKHIVAALDAYAEARRRAIRAPVIADTADRWAFTLRELRRPLEADQILDEAVRVIETFVGTLRPQADVLAALGELEARRGRLPEAMAWFEKAAQAASRAEIAHGWRERARELRDNAGRPR